MSRCFFDSNILLYSINRDDPRRERAAMLLNEGGAISVQCLNEFAAVALRKLHWSWPQIRAALDTIAALCAPVIVLDRDLQQLGVNLAERHQFGVYDAMIVAAALTARCDTLYSEDMHDGLVVDGRLTIVNPFA